MKTEIQLYRENRPTHFQSRLNDKIRIVMKTNPLHLILSNHWYDLILNGMKRVEFRNNNAYWAKRLQGKEVVIFHRGYTNITIIFKIQDIKIHTINEDDVSISIAPAEWLGKEVFAIELGNCLR